MPNLFPVDAEFEHVDIETLALEPEDFQGSYVFDFERGDFVKGPDGKIMKANRYEAYIQWCQKALTTERYKHISYSDAYGQEYYTLIGSGLSKDAIELEVERMTKEALFVHPYTSDIDSFEFSWSQNQDELYFNFEVKTIEDENFIIEHTIKVR